MFDVQELFAQVNRLKKAGGCVSNNYLTLPALTEFSEQEDSLLTYNEDAIALICEDVGVTRLHFYLSSLEAASALKELLERTSRRPIVVDCVGKKEQAEAISEALCREGFSFYTCMGRLRRPETIICPDMGGIVRNIHTEQGDVDEILAGLEETFDPMVSHLPDRNRLLHLIKEKLVYCLRDDGKIVAVICMERVGRRGIYCYQGYVSSEKRGKGYGKLIYRIAVDCCRDCSPFTTWVEDKNTQVLKIWYEFGFAPDGLRDTILIYR